MSLHEDIFKPALKLGLNWQAKIAERLASAGLEINSLDDDPSAADERSGPTTEFANTDDLVVEGWPLEVKAMAKVGFTCPRDVPFSPIRFGRVEAWERKKIWPIAVVMVSSPTEEAIVLPVPPQRSARLVWLRETIRVRGFNETMYAAPREWWHPFDALTTWLRENRNELET